MTSATNPIRVDEVDLKLVPGLKDVTGRIGMTFLPGKRGTYGLAGRHDRDLKTDAATLRALGVDVQIVLVNDDELELAGVPALVDGLRAAGIEVRRFRIPDAGIPSDRRAFSFLLDDIQADLHEGRFVAVNCMGGCGRTGTVVGCLLAQNGLDGDAAVRLTRASRHCAIENQAQEDFVREWQRIEPVMERRLLGVVEVDSGMLLVGDPLYVLPRKQQGKAGVDYQVAMDTDATEHGTPLGGTPTVLLQGFGGDGTFPVIGEFEGGELMRATIEFMEPPE